MDEALVDRLGMTIAQWVKDKGWESFRTEESRLLQELSVKKRVVVATGGGVVEKPENRKILKNSFFVIWLSCSVEEIANRLAKDEKSINSRPSLTGLGLLEEVSEVLNRREPLYREVGSVVIEVSNKTPDEIGDFITQIVFVDDQLRQE
jgi:shikimate kinase